MGVDDKLDFGKHYLLLNQKIENHIKAHNNPHKVIPADLGLEKVENRGTDTLVTQDSENYVTSGAVFNALLGDIDLINKKQDKLTVNPGIDTTLAKLTSITIDDIPYAISVFFDEELNAFSDNGVQNRVVTRALAGKQPLLTAGSSISINPETFEISVLKDQALDDNSTGVVPNRVIKAALDTKQPNLTELQIAAVNSGINTEKVTKYEGYESIINSKANSVDVYTKTEANDLLQTKQSKIGTGELIGDNNLLPSDFITDEGYNHKFITSTERADWNNKQDKLVSEGLGQNLKTVGGNDLLGTGNIPFPTIPVLGVEVNDVSVVDREDKIAKIIMPTKVSNLENDLAFVETNDLETNYPTFNYLFEYHDNSKQNVINLANPLDAMCVTGLADVAYSGDYNDLSDTPDLKLVATTGSYNDLYDKPDIPTIPTNISAFTNDSGYIKNSATNLIYYTLTEDLADVATSGDYDDLVNKPAFAAVATTGSYNNLVDKPSLATVATSGDYNDLINRPTIPTLVSQLENDKGYLTADDVHGEGLASEAWVTANFAKCEYIDVTPPEGDPGILRIPYSIIAQYKIVTFYGFKYNIGVPNQTSFTLIPSQLALDPQRRIMYRASARAGSNNWQYGIYVKRGIDSDPSDNYVWWWTEPIPDTDDLFYVTAIVGVK